jgi:hypothetical protein
MMAVTGIVLLLQLARKFIKFSAKKLFIAPFISLVVSLLIAWVFSEIFTLSTDWGNGLLKLSFFSLVYITILFTLERKELLASGQFLLTKIFPKMNQNQT